MSRRRGITYQRASWRTIRDWVSRQGSNLFELTDKRTGQRRRFTREEAYLLCSFGILGAFR